MKLAVVILWFFIIGENCGDSTPGAGSHYFSFAMSKTFRALSVKHNVNEASLSSLLKQAKKGNNIEAVLSRLYSIISKGKVPEKKVKDLVDILMGSSVSEIKAARSTAAHCLAGLAVSDRIESKEIIENVVIGMLSLLDDDVPEVRHHATSAVYWLTEKNRIPDEMLSKVLTRVLFRTGDEDVNVRTTAIAAIRVIVEKDLALVEQVELVVSVMLAHMEDSDVDTRVNAIRAIGFLVDSIPSSQMEFVVNSLLKTFDDSHPNSRSHALWCIGVLIDADKVEASYSDKIFALLLSMVDDEDDDAKQNVVGNIAALADKDLIPHDKLPAILQLFLAKAANRNDRSCCNAITGIGNMMSYKHDSLCSSSNVETVVTSLKLALTSHHPDIRNNTVLAFGVLIEHDILLDEHYDSIIDLLLVQCADEDTDVRRNATWCVSTCVERQRIKPAKMDQVLTVFRNSADDKYEWVRVNAVFGLSLVASFNLIPSHMLAAVVSLFIIKVNVDMGSRYRAMDGLCALVVNGGCCVLPRTSCSAPAVDTTSANMLDAVTMHSFLEEKRSQGDAFFDSCSDLTAARRIEVRRHMDIAIEYLDKLLCLTPSPATAAPTDTTVLDRLVLDVDSIELVDNGASSIGTSADDVADSGNVVENSN